MDEVLKLALAHPRPDEFLPSPTSASTGASSLQADPTVPSSAEPH